MSNITQQEQAYREQATLVTDLQELYSLVNVCRLSLTGLGQDETDSAAAVLLTVVNRLHDMGEVHRERESALEAIAYPENGGVA